jgi:hypothetical protein
MHAAAPTSWTHQALLSPAMRRFALLVLVGSVFMPVTGLGVDLCPLHHATGLPCPGCGMTRALAAMSQGEPGLALGLNPFVLFVWPVVVGLALLAFAPSSVVGRVEALARSRDATITRGYLVVLAAFLGFGALRFVTMLALGMRFP